MGCNADYALCRRTQRCWPATPNIVGQQCCARLHVAKSLTGFKLCATALNNTRQQATGCANGRNLYYPTILGVVGQQYYVRLQVGWGGGGGLGLTRAVSGERWRRDKRDPRSSLSKSYRNELPSYSVEVSLLSPEVNTLSEDVSCKAKFWVCLRKDMAWRFKRTLFTRSSASHHLLWSFFETMKFVGVQPRPRLFALTKGHLCIFRL